MKTKKPINFKYFLDLGKRLTQKAKYDLPLLIQDERNNLYRPSSIILGKDTEGKDYLAIVITEIVPDGSDIQEGQVRLRNKLIGWIANTFVGKKVGDLWAGIVASAKGLLGR